MVVGFTTTYVISSYHHWCCGFDCCSGRGVEHYVIKFVSHLLQVSGFLRILQFQPPIKLTTTYNWNIIESSVKHHKIKIDNYGYFFSLLYIWFLLQGIKYYEQLIRQKVKKTIGTDTESDVDPEIYCSLGHLLLLLEQYPKGANRLTSSIALLYLAHMIQRVKHTIAITWPPSSVH